MFFEDGVNQEKVPDAIKISIEYTMGRNDDSPMKKIIPLLISSLLFLSSCGGGKIVPPIVTLRDIAGMDRIAEGELISLGEHVRLFIPRGYSPPESGELSLTVHFHGAFWFAMEEHARRGATNPLLMYGGLQGSSAYKEPFLNRELFGNLLREVESELEKRDEIPIRVSGVEISSFSAGYGAVREILKSPEYVEMIDAVILADSMYAAFANPGTEDRTPREEHVSPFIDFARLAAKGNKIFIVAHASMVTKDYASPTDCARYLVSTLGESLEPVEPGSLPSSAPKLDYPLKTRFDAGGLHVWGYGGTDAKSHMAMARALADYWNSLE